MPERVSLRNKERRNRLIEELLRGKSDIDELANQFGVSLSTIRRDLQALAKDGHIYRTYGGAIPTHHVPEESFIHRMEHHGEKKRAIARAAVQFVQNSDTLILDAGSTVCALAQLLGEKEIRIITNNLMLVPIIAHMAGIEFVVLGGKCRTTSMGTFGPLALGGLEQLTADIVFMSADGVIAGKGLCEASMDQIALKRAMMARANQTIILADSSKINRAERHVWANFPKNTILISDKDMSNSDVSAFEAHGVKVILA